MGSGGRRADRARRRRRTRTDPGRNAGRGDGGMAAGPGSGHHRPRGDPAHRRARSARLARRGRAAATPCADAGAGGRAGTAGSRRCQGGRSRTAGSHRPGLARRARQPAGYRTARAGRATHGRSRGAAGDRMVHRRQHHRPGRTGGAVRRPRVPRPTGRQCRAVPARGAAGNGRTGRRGAANGRLPQADRTARFRPASARRRGGGDVPDGVRRGEAIQRAAPVGRVRVHDPVRGAGRGAGGDAERAGAGARFVPGRLCRAGAARRRGRNLARAVHLHHDPQFRGDGDRLEEELAPAQPVGLFRHVRNCEPVGAGGL